MKQSRSEIILALLKPCETCCSLEHPLHPSPWEKAGRDQRKYRKGIAARWVNVINDCKFPRSKRNTPLLIKENVNSTVSTDRSNQKIKNTYKVAQAQALHKLRQHFVWQSQQVVNLMFRREQKRRSWQRSCVCQLVKWSERDSSVLLISHCQVSQREVTKCSCKTWMAWKDGRGRWLFFMVCCVQMPPLFPSPSFPSQNVFLRVIQYHMWSGVCI